ncbi:phosphatidylglycerophosphate synthase [Caulobacter ginsengisoli]|uniref:Phosphatidylglycerophosphate synthase n=1 Tax=Caulobacter ginsengisoli TaxID=400775 RepID=A0ABU0ITN9_9CAUL|nr:CDP-alcohol phosphatidyltransferase family protein [Caulobacter ginsengisoli]MDQ0464790.1 phosphatidylglycerophosphate synthase [Caulobacter ginsengisoli]
MSDTPENRRPLKIRGAGWAQALAASLGKAGASPDLISATSIAFAVTGAGFFLASGVSEGAFRAICLIVAATCVQLRLLANMLDGMVAVEHGRGSPAGPIWNELPDRIADAFFLVAAGYAAADAGVSAGVALGWACAVLAVLTAYVRELGRGLGFPADFSGPMAKPHRMFALTVTCVVAALEPLWGWSGESLAIGLAVIAIGTVWTAARRTRTLARRLKEKS